jgi:hypothetical protein
MFGHRRRSSRYHSRRRSRYDGDYRSYGRRRRRGCLTDIQDFFTNLLITIVLIAITGFALYFTLFHFAQVVALVTTLAAFVSLLIRILPFILNYGLYIAGALLGLAVIFLVVSSFSSISERHAIASEARAHAKQQRQRAEQERLRAEQQRVQVEQQRVKLDRDRQIARDEHERRRSLALAQTTRATGRTPHTPHATRLLSDDPSASTTRQHSYAAQGYAVPPPSVQQSLPPSEAEPYEQAPGMPAMPRVQKVRYRAIAHLVPPGQMPALVRADGSLLLTTWTTGYKLTLIVGSSSSGKTITAAGKVHGFLESMGGRGRILPCDPHETKDDALFNIIAPLAPALFVDANGQAATFAVSQQDILANMRMARQELERRVAGADASVPILLIVEEFNKLMRNKLFAKEMKEIFVTLGQEARGYNVFCLINCQTVKYLAEVRESFLSFIVQRVSAPARGRVALSLQWLVVCAHVGSREQIAFVAGLADLRSRWKTMIRMRMRAKRDSVALAIVAGDARRELLAARRSGRTQQLKEHLEHDERTSRQRGKHAHLAQQLQQIDGQGQHDNGQHTKRGRMRCGGGQMDFHLSSPSSPGATNTRGGFLLVNGRLKHGLQGDTEAICFLSSEAYRVIGIIVLAGEISDADALIAHQKQRVRPKLKLLHNSHRRVGWVHSCLLLSCC